MASVEVVFVAGSSKVKLEAVLGRGSVTEALTGLYVPVRGTLSEPWRLSLLVLDCEGIQMLSPGGRRDTI